jgi:L-amino acid N-acyltransferase YncA
MIVRAATAADLPAVRDLFNALIPTTTVAWREEPAAPSEIATWFAQQVDANNPVLVADDGEVVGYTCWSAFRGGPRFPGYRHTAELTIHVRSDQQGRGVGRALMDALIAEAEARSIHVLVAGIDADNVESIAFHAALGFTEVARMPEVGRKFDRWLDLVLMQRVIDGMGR